jgi:hypothetical protein
LSNSQSICKRDSTVAASENLNSESDTGWEIVYTAP